MNNAHHPTDLQRAILLTLRELDRVCQVLDVSYAAYGGTAIGAVRHQGFIPWDDDADVCMPREDYDRFLAEAPGVLGKDFVLLSQASHPGYCRPFAVLGLEGTAFVSSASATSSQRSPTIPVGLDVFPLDVMPQDQRVFARQSRRTWWWGRLMFLAVSPSPQTGLPFPLAQAASAVFRTVHWALGAARVTPAVLYRRWERAARAGEGTGSQVLADYCTRDPRRWSVRRDELFPVARMPFEDIEIAVPGKYDDVLTRGYGLYMQLPPPEERMTHDPVLVDLGRFADA
ncbi:MULTISPECIES: LicD family protein [unclassified Actinomyces]|uniref:LicD family protein n=1 Tax=unclassified Actinomyces TaxID=2609248 RepID=UPI0020176DE1|nr:MULTISPECIES: LicD family protein [unclassified Actinomyces]MCL3777006.1 LicD family protein [Actinomyces sp. AC-20-1]MCL3789061.1 LicD family protein [Actinomyces sp. 187325]MCL3791425.1 LicD family protein [Actinomyces sp. 186855]MCL3794045.1 LicD family protein [Actinomyces sp. 217892]